MVKIVVGMPINRQVTVVLRPRITDITTAGAETFDFAPLGGRVLCYLYNPFGPGLMRRFLERLRDLDVVLIYNNPSEDATLRELGFVACVAKDGGCPNAHTVVYANRRRPAN